MTILVDSTEDEVTVDLNQTAEPQAPAPQNEEPQAPEVPDKFKGKSAEEIASAYTNLESELGRLRNELGDYRNMTDRFLSIEEKRVADLEQAGEQTEFKVDPTELLADPEKVLRDNYQHMKQLDPEYNELKSRLDRIEGHVSQSALQQSHADAVDITNSPEFHSWLGDNPYRAQIAQAAVANQDVAALDYLLTEFKGQSGRSASEGSAQQSVSETQQAAAVSMESSSSGNPAGTQKRFSRRKLVQLKIQNPEEYAAMGQEILSAYAEGRVDD